jgi:predicted Mrr-cat superfamily restriction endonuclease
MVGSAQTVWGARAGGEHFDACEVFRNGDFCVGWPDIGDLAELPADQNAIKKHLEVTHRDYPGISSERIQQGAGVLYRLKYLVQHGDIVVYEDKPTGKMYLGTVAGPYRFDLGVFAQAPHLRRVIWKHKYPTRSLTTKLTVRGHGIWEISQAQEFRDLMED